MGWRRFLTSQSPCKRPAKEVTRKSARVCLSPPLSTSHGREWCETAQANAALSAAGTIVRIRYPSQSGGQNDDSRADLYGKLEELENRTIAGCRKEALGSDRAHRFCDPAKRHP